jgi:hypothetical protein
MLRSNATEPVVQVEEEDWFDPNKMQIVGSITKHLNDAFAKESKVTKGDCFNWAMAFRAEQGRQASKLYQYILKSMQDKPVRQPRGKKREKKKSPNS